MGTLQEKNWPLIHTTKEFKTGLELLFLDSYSLQFVLIGFSTLSKSNTVLNCEQKVIQEVVATATMT